jgi:hypothetical protein
VKDLIERLRGGKCPTCNGWGELAFGGEMVNCGCLGRYESPISMETRQRAADTLQSQADAAAKLVEENEALVHDLTRSMDTANHYVNECAKLAAALEHIAIAESSECRMLARQALTEHEGAK